jgi:catechol 2,3-dioxygenase-like lactoylglutathione lyase family enzyme
VIGHLSLGVYDLDRAVRFYDAVLAPVGMVRVWEQDDSPELDRTMKALDQRLRQAEQWENTFGRRRGTRQAEPPAEPAAEAGQEPTLH